MQTFLTKDQVTSFRENGVLTIPDFISSEQADELRKECHRLVDDFDIDRHRGVFHCGDDQGANVDKYFFDSSENISFFLESDALNASKEIVVDKHRAINKIGHALHHLSAPFQKVTFSDRVKGILRDLEFKEPGVVQSMYIFKQPKIGGLVNEHQDASFLWSEPSPKLIGLWIALEDATLENGCLWFAPGSHKEGLRNDRHFFRDERNKMVFTSELGALPEDQFSPAPVPKGTLVLIDGFVVHQSHANRSEKSREIYTWHVTELDDRQWSAKNWLQTKSPFRNAYED